MVNNNSWLEIISLLGLLLLPLLLIFFPLEIGKRLGRRTRELSGEIDEAPIGSSVGAALGLLAFMLALTFQITATRYETRKQLVLDEATSIRAVYLYAALIPEPHRSDTRKLLREYVGLRAKTAIKFDSVQHFIKRSEELHKKLWVHAEALADQDRSSEIYSLFTSSLNDLIEVHSKRVTIGLQYRIPAVIMWVLYFITFFSMTVLGYQFGISGKGNFIINLVLALIFSSVMGLIFALDRPEKGIIKVSQFPIFILQQELKENP